MMQRYLEKKMKHARIQSATMRLPQSRRGFSLLETTVSTMLVSLLMVASLSSIAHVNRVAHHPNYSQQAAQLAQLYFGEITSKLYTTNQNNSTNLGRAASETLPDRTTWDDCDDYHAVNLTSLTYADGSVIPEAEGWILLITVNYSEPSDPFNAVSYTTDLKVITLAFTDPTGQRHDFQSLRSRYGPLHGPSQTDLLSSLEIHAESTDSNLTTSARIMNQQGTP
ncbi:MAG: hypothetical protein ACE361_18250 [Aureliella sp.]